MWMIVQVFMNAVTQNYVCVFRYVLAQTLYRGRQARTEHGLGFDFVNDLTQKWQWNRHHIYCDSLFTSLYLAETLLRRQTYFCGTFRANMRGMPRAIQQPPVLPRGESVKRQKGDVVACVWRDKRDVRVLSTNTNPEDTQVTREAPRNRQQVMKLSFLYIMLLC